MSADASPERSPERPIRRATVVYGKRSNRLSLPAVVLPVGEHQDCVHQPQPPAVLSERRPSSSSSDHASDCEPFRSPDATDGFQFSFRHRLKQLDEEFEERDAQLSRRGQPPSGTALHAGPSQAKDRQSVLMATSILSSEARRSPGDVSPVSLSSSPTSLHATSTQEYPPETPIRTRGASIPVPSEAGESGRSSSVSPVRHAITTPHSRSSPTPPTSGEIPMASRKAKGKAPARDMLPLLFDDERPLTAERPVKSKKARRAEPAVRPKTKAPTKKEQRESVLESSRIAADRPVEVTRTQGRKRSLATLLNTIQRDKLVTPTLGAELPSDPIERFSSPTNNSAQVPHQNNTFGSPTALLRSSTYEGRTDRPSCENSAVLPPPADDSDDEMPSITSIIQRKSGTRERLQAMKQVALRYADTRRTSDTNSDDDDLLVVNDDMHAVAREEAAQRRLDKAHGSPVKDLATLRRINHPSVRPVVVSPQKLSEQEWHELAKPAFARKGKGSKGQLTKKQLDQLMIMQHTEVQLKMIKQHEEKWVKGGGKLSRNIGGDGPQTSLSQKLAVYAEQGLMAMEARGEVGSEESADEDDEDYVPGLQGSASPEPMDMDEDGSGDDMVTSQPPQPQVDEEEDIVVPLKRNKSGQRYLRVVMGSDDEEEQPILCNLPKDSTSSMESQTEDENDKENSAKLMYDRSEDKENKAVVRHERSTSEITFGSRLGSLLSGIPESSPLASTMGFDDITGSPKGDGRSPLKDISREEDDLFLSSPSRNSSFTEGLLRGAAISPPRPLTSTLSLGSPPVLRSDRVRRIDRLSLDSENDENDPSGFKPLQPSFLERLHSQVGPEPSLAPIKPIANGGFSQLFSAEDQSSTKIIGGAKNRELSLTLDVGLRPALEVSCTLRQKAEIIFEKEQGYVVAAAVHQNDRPKELLYVNDHGFLTQTRPEGSSPQAYHMTPSQASKVIGTQVHSPQTELLSNRPPLRTLSFTLSPQQQPLRRLRRRSPSPLEQKSREQNNPVPKLNAFSVLGKPPELPSEAEKEKLGKSEFVAAEAEESDEDDMFGFGGPKKDDDEEEDGDEQDKVVEGLVDDAVMDAETEAVDLVLEKHREYGEEEDQRLQKLHQDAVEGKFRIKRRGGGIGVEDESDDDDDDEARRIRQRIYKKRKIEGDSLEALGQNEETRAFYNTYHQDLIDGDDEFKHLREDTSMPMPVDDDDPQAAEPEKQETISVHAVRRLMRDVAENKLVIDALDPEDTSWVDRSMRTEADDAVSVKVVKYLRTRSINRNANTGQVDFDVARPARQAENEQERKQMTTWANKQSHRRQGTGRAGTSTAVTGHTKVKAGGGSLRSAQSSSAATASGIRKTVAKTSSMLSTVSSRRDRFA